MLDKLRTKLVFYFTSKLLSLFVLLVLVVLATYTINASVSKPKYNEGFKNTKWGTSCTDVLAKFKDLEFYQIVNDKIEDVDCKSSDSIFTIAEVGQYPGMFFFVFDKNFELKEGALSVSENMTNNDKKLMVQVLTDKYGNPDAVIDDDDSYIHVWITEESNITAVIKDSCETMEDSVFCIIIVFSELEFFESTYGGTQNGGTQI